MLEKLGNYIKLHPSFSFFLRQKFGKNKIGNSYKQVTRHLRCNIFICYFTLTFESQIIENIRGFQC